jgi:hypothetical protein
MNFSVRHVATEATSSFLGGCGISRGCGAATIFTVTAPVWRTDFLNTRASHFRRRVVVAVSSGLEELHWDLEVQLDLFAGNNRANDDGKEDNQEYKVQDGVADYSALAKLGLFQRVDRWTDLTTINY